MPHYNLLKRAGLASHRAMRCAWFGRQLHRDSATTPTTAVAHANVSKKDEEEQFSSLQSIPTTVVTTADALITAVGGDVSFEDPLTLRVLFLQQQSAVSFHPSEKEETDKPDNETEQPSNIVRRRPTGRVVLRRNRLFVL